MPPAEGTLFLASIMHGEKDWPVWRDYLLRSVSYSNTRQSLIKLLNNDCARF